MSALFPVCVPEELWGVSLRSGWMDGKRCVPIDPAEAETVSLLSSEEGPGAA